MFDAYMLAAVYDQGLFRFHNGLWTNVSTEISGEDGAAPGMTRLPIEWGRWATGNYNKFIYLLDRSHTSLPGGTDRVGIWRSSNWGASWERIWKPGNADNHFPNSDDYIGFLALDPDNDGALYFSSKAGLRKIVNADTCTAGAGCAPAVAAQGQSLPTDQLGPVGFTPDGDHLVVVSRVGDGNDTAQVWVGEDDDTNWHQLALTNSEILDSAAYAITDIAITEDETVFLSSRGQGVILIEDAIS